MSGSPGQKPLRVLVLVEDADERALASAMLAPPVFEAVPVNDAVAFAEELAGNRFDALVLEPRLRWGDALHVLDAVKRSGRTRAVVLLAADQDEAVLAGYRRGLDEHVAKTPKGFVQLPNAVREAVARASQTSGESDSRWQRLLDKLGRATFTANPDGRILEANQAFAELLGFPSVREATRANAFTLLLPEGDRETLVEKLNAERFLKLDSIPLAVAGGRTQDASLALSLQKGPSGAPTVAGLVERVPETHVEVEELPAKAMATAHDLKEPLRTLVRSAEALRTRHDGKLGREAQEELGFLVDAARRMQAQVGKLFGESTKAEDPLPRDTTGGDLAAAFERAVANLRGSIEAAGARVTADPLPTVGVPLEELVQLLQNLLGNAVKYRGDEPPRVHVSAARRDAWWSVAITDNGLGVPAADRERIFELFQRIDRGPAFPGSGIGLSVCKRIVERHGGRITVEGGELRGSTFRFTVPVLDASSERAPVSTLSSARPRAK